MTHLGLTPEELEAARWLAVRWTTAHHGYQGSTEACEALAAYARHLEGQLSRKLEQLEALRQERDAAWGIDRDGHRHGEPRWSLLEIELWLRALGVSVDEWSAPLQELRRGTPEYRQAGPLEPADPEVAPVDV